MNRTEQTKEEQNRVFIMLCNVVVDDTEEKKPKQINKYSTTQ
jgi:hypothetical protein